MGVDLAVQGDGKALVLGFTESSSGGGDLALARYEGGGGTGSTLPRPRAGEAVNVATVRGVVRVRERGSRRFVALGEARQIRVGSLVDTLRGRVRLTSAANRSGSRTQSGIFHGGLFRVAQNRARRPVTELRLAGALAGCPGRGQGGTAQRRVRRLRSNATGRFRTRGKNSAATVRGAQWVVEDRCNTTLTRVVRGSVAVRDFARRRTVALRAGQRYVARQRRR